jgi:hypothetical protein
MERNHLSPEEKAEQALQNFEGIKQAELPADFEAKMFARFDAEFAPVKTPKWFWAAAAVLLVVNLTAAFTVSNNQSEKQTVNSVTSFYFKGGTDWYQE